MDLDKYNKFILNSQQVGIVRNGRVGFVSLMNGITIIAKKFISGSIKCKDTKNNKDYHKCLTKDTNNKESLHFT